MRITAFILNLLMAVMVLAPCRDHKSLGMSKTRIQEVASSTPGNGQADDDCSPLCTCSCCASVSPLVHMPVVESIAPAQPAKKYPVYIAPGYAAELSAVWQPPRIG